MAAFEEAATSCQFRLRLNRCPVDVEVQDIEVEALLRLSAYSIARRPATNATGPDFFTTCFAPIMSDVGFAPREQPPFPPGAANRRQVRQ